jgi:carbonic anhydrase
MLAGVVEPARRVGLRPVVIGLAEEHRARFLAAAHDEENAERIVVSTEREALEGLEGAPQAEAGVRLRAGIERYRRMQRPRYASLFEELGKGQKPHTLFITCVDSRVNPNLITNTDPGELFIARNVGNVVGTVSTLAAVEYAVAVLGVGHIVVCGHSSCGAVHALLSDDDVPAELGHLKQWLDDTRARERLKSLPCSLAHDEVARIHALAQLDALMALPIVKGRVELGELTISTWFFDVKSGEVEEWSKSAQRFLPIGASHEPAALAG